MTWYLINLVLIFIKMRFIFKGKVFLHFYIETFSKNHVDPWCHKMCNPKYVSHLYSCSLYITIIRDARSLDNVNTESCEQTFKYGFKYIFFEIIFDLYLKMGKHVHICQVDERISVLDVFYRDF